MSLLRRILDERWLYVIGFFALGVGLAWGKSLVSISVGILLGAWLFEGLYHKDLDLKWRQLRADRRFWAAMILLCCLSFSLLWTADLSKGIRVWKTFLPLGLLSPVFFSSHPFPALTWRRLYLLHLLALGAACAFMWINASMEGLMDADPREWMLFSSHIRLSLMLVLGIPGCFFLASGRSKVVSLGLGLLALWFLVFLWRASMMTGLAIGIVLLIVGLFRSPQSRFERGARIVMLLSLLSSGAWLLTQSFAYFQVHDADSIDPAARSAEGRAYTHIMDNKTLQDGHYIYRYVQEQEIREAWSQRSSMDLNGDPMLYDRILRYVSSLGKRKDKSAIMDLTAEEIIAIEQGAVSAYPKSKPLERRWTGLLYELDSYRNGGDPSSNSMTQRFEYWRAALCSIAESPWGGSGLGDASAHLDACYASIDRLHPSVWRLSHQQYLSFLVLLGVPLGGLCIFCLFLILFGSSRAPRSSLYLCFVLVFLLSCLSENTLESQMGMGFFLYYIGMTALRPSE